MGAFMIFVHFFNKNSKNRTDEIKEIIASSSYKDAENEESIEELEEQTQMPTLLEENNSVLEKNLQKIEQTKACEYCGTLADINDKVCASCGAKFKKIKKD